MKFIVSAPKPRNPCVAPAKFRRAGSHRPQRRSLRQDGARALRRELDSLKHRP